jgi:hypothetical protein
VTLIVDSQSVKAASTVGKNSRVYDAAKKINGRKRHITVDTLGLPVMITVTPADIQDRDAARDVFWRLRLTQPQITQIWADRGYGGDLVNWARELLWLTAAPARRSPPELSTHHHDDPTPHPQKPPYRQLDEETHRRRKDILPNERSVALSGRR